MTLTHWLHNATQRLTQKGIASARRDSQIILGHVLGQDLPYVLREGNHEIDAQAQKEADTLLERRFHNEPIAYLVGEKEFFNLTFKTDKRALIPRWESELLVDTARETLEKLPKGAVVAEIGTGAGALCITLAKHFPQHTFYATDISDKALDLAKENAQRHGIKSSFLTGSANWRNPDRESKTSSLRKRGSSIRDASLSVKDDVPCITFLQGDLGEPLSDAGLEGKIDVLVANLPYIPTSLLKNLDATITYYEPNVALEGGEDGLDYYRMFIPQAKGLLKPGGVVLCEHDYDQGEPMRQLAHKTFPDARIETLQDNLAHDRVLVVKT